MAFVFQTSFSFIIKHNKFRQLSAKEKLKLTNPVQSYEFLNKSWESYGAKTEKCHNFPNPFRFFSFSYIYTHEVFDMLQLNLKAKIRNSHQKTLFWLLGMLWYPSITFPTKKVCQIRPKIGTYLDNKMHSVTGQLILHDFEIQSS